MFKRVYLDNSATTPVDPRVVEAMLPFFTEKFGNASSIHFFGQEARAAVDKARHQVAELINARPNEIIFTSGGTESNNLAIRGLVQANPSAGKHLIVSVIEHPAVRNVCEDLEASGYETTRLPVYENGIVRLEDVQAALRGDTVLISIMTANNEIGTLQPAAEIGRLVRGLREQGRKIWFHTDAVQAVGKTKIDVEEMGCDLLSMSAHKLYAPKGIGALYVRRGVRLHQQNLGGRQERGLRGGTESVPSIVALGQACEIAGVELEAETVRLRTLRDRLENEIAEQIPDSAINGDRNSRLAGILNVSFPGVEGEGLLINLDMRGIAVSAGSACSSGSIEPSPIIQALGKGDDVARGAIRFSLGRFNTSEEIDHLMTELPAAVNALRALSPAKERSAGK